uniref:Uncharacterized protein n=1 Tax=Zosterops lateralis melanops TaxID=1220523 RepID=A0A8D2QVA2_ZOSLA
SFCFQTTTGKLEEEGPGDLSTPSPGIIIFLFVSQVTGVDCDSCLDFLLCHFHAIIKHLKELLRFLIFCQSAEEGMLQEKRNSSWRYTPRSEPRQFHLSALCGVLQDWELH